MDDCIYCIMISNRPAFIPKAIKNFNEQTYSNKKLITITDDTIDIPNSYKTHGLTLGDKRNYGISLVPLKSLWTTWDDDDIRHPTYLEKLHEVLKKTNSDTVFLTNRLEHNIINSFTYKSTFKQGMPFFLTKKHPDFNYLSKDTLEDIEVFKDLTKINTKITIYNNDPSLYIRVIHGNNTSTYILSYIRNNIVNYSKSSNYHEYHVSPEELKYVYYKINEYYPK